MDIYNIFEKLDTVFPSFFIECESYINRYDNVFSRGNRLNWFFGNTMNDQASQLLEEDIDVYFYALGYIEYQLFYGDSVTVTKFKDLADHEIFLNYPNIWGFKWGKYFLEIQNKKDSNTNSILEEKRREKAEKENIKREKSVLVEDVLDYCHYMIELCFRIANTDLFPAEWKTEYYSKLLKLMDGILQDESVICNDITVNINDCEYLSRFYEDDYLELLFELFDNKVLFVLYDNYLLYPSQDLLRRLLLYSYFNTKLYGYSSSNKVFVLGRHFWEDLISKTNDSNPNETEITYVENDGNYNPLNRLKDYIDYEEANKCEMRELCELVDGYISDLLFDNKGRTFVQEKIWELKNNPSLKGFNEFVRVSFKNGYTLDSINEDLFLIDFDISKDFYAEDRLLFKYADDKTNRFDINKYIDLILEDYDDELCVFDGSTSCSLDKIVEKCDYGVRHIEGYDIALYNNEVLNKPNIIYRNELNTEAQNDNNTVYILEKTETDLYGGINKLAEAEELSHEECIDIVKKYVQKNINGYLKDCLADIQNTVKDYAHIYFDICMLGNIEKNARKNGYIDYYFSCTDMIAKGKKVIYKKDLWEKIDSTWEEKSNKEQSDKEAILFKSILRIIRDTIRRINDTESIEEAFLIEKEASESLKFLQGNCPEDIKILFEEIIETTASTIEKLMCKKASEKNGMISISRDGIEDKTYELFIVLEKKTERLIDQKAFKTIKDKVISFIYTGEVLYNSFIINPNITESKEIDYGIISLEYYKAVEYLTNQMFYKPYIPYIEKDDDIDKKQKYYICSKQGKAKEQLEFGTIANVLSNISKMPNYESFLYDRGISVVKLREFAEDMIKLKDERNQSAHPYQKSLNRAKKDRAYIYEDDISIEKNTAISIRELLFSLKNVFY